MPYRVDIARADDGIVERLIELGAVDVDGGADGSVAALMPDGVERERVGAALGRASFRISPAVGRDDGSVWVLRPRPTRVGRVDIVPADADASAGALRLVDSPAFGTGLHATTALCLEAIQRAVDVSPPASLLDAGTGSGILALAGLLLGIPRATAIDTDASAIRVTAENARLNGLMERLELVHGGPEAVAGAWPLVVANVLAAPLIEMAPTLVRRIGHHGTLVLSGIADGLETSVIDSYRHLGMRHSDTQSRDGWSLVTLTASW